MKDQKISIIAQELKKLRQEVADKDIYVTGFKRELGNIVSSMTNGKELEDSVRKLYKKYVRGEKLKAGATNKLTTDKIGDLLKSKEDVDGDPKPIGRRNSLVIFTAMPPVVNTSANPQVNPMPAGADGGFLSSHSIVHKVEEALIEHAKEATRQKQFVEKEATGLKHRLEANRDGVEREARNRLKENSSLLFECNNLRREVKDLERKLDISHSKQQDLFRVIDMLKKQVEDGGGGLAAAQRDAMINSAPNDMYYLSAPSPVSTAGASKPGTAQSAGLFVIDEGTSVSAASQNQSMALPAMSLPPAIGDGSHAGTNKATYALNSSLGPLGAQHKATTMVMCAAGARARSPNEGEISLAGRHIVRMRETDGDNQAQGGMIPGYDHEGIDEGKEGTGAGVPYAGGYVPARTVSPINSSYNLIATGAKPMRGSGKGGSVGRDLGQKNLVRKYERLYGEVEILQSHLDEAQRERDMQRLEISRLRKSLLMHQTGQGIAGSISPITGTLNVYTGAGVPPQPIQSSLHTHGAGFRQRKGGEIGMGLGALQTGHFLHGATSSVISASSSNGERQVGWVDGYYFQQYPEDNASPVDDISLSGSALSGVVNTHTEQKKNHNKGGKLTTTNPVSVDLSLNPIEGGGKLHRSQGKIR